MEGKPVDLVYSTHGPKSTKPPIIFLHGLTSSKESLEEVAGIIGNATHRTAYAVDARNHGDSPSSDEFSFDLNADDVLHLMDKMGWEKAIVVGHSMGGITAIKTALKAPSRIEMLVVEDIGVRRIDAILDQSIKYMDLCESGLREIPQSMDDIVEANKFFHNFVYGNLAHEFEGILKKDNLANNDKAIRPMIKRTPEGTFRLKTNTEVIRRAVKNKRALMKDNTGRYDGKAKFIYGENSMFKVKEQKDDIKRLFPNADLVSVSDTLHCIHIEKQQDFIDIVVNFIMG